jgi:hypothetical protein
MNPSQFGAGAARAEQLISAQQQQQDRQAQAVQARHDKEHSMVVDLMSKGHKVKALINHPNFNNLTGPDWDLLKSQEQINAKQEKIKGQQQLGKDVREPLAQLGSAAALNPRDPQAQRNLQANLAPFANDPNVLNRLGPDIGAANLEARGQLPGQVAGAAKIRRAARVAEQDPLKMQPRLAAEIRLRMAEGVDPSPAERAFLDELINADPMTQFRRAAFSEALKTSRGFVGTESRAKPSRATAVEATRKAFKSDPEMKGFKPTALKKHSRDLSPMHKRILEQGGIMVIGPNGEAGVYLP